MSSEAASPEAQQEQDELLIQQALDPESKLDFSRELEPGEKADDAVDYEDLSDGDLAEDETLQPEESFSTMRASDPISSFNDLNSLTHEDDLLELTNGSGADGDGFDDLFGDMPQSPVDFYTGQSIETEGTGMAMSFDFENDHGLHGTSAALATMPPSQAAKPFASSKESLFRAIDFTAKDQPLSREQQLQQDLFAMSRSGFGSTDFPPAPPENQEELLASLWPKFEQDTVPRFMDLLPPKKARFVGKVPLKKPKSVLPTKVSLELAQDQEKIFKVVTTTHQKTVEDLERQGLIVIPDIPIEEEASEDELDVESDYENEPIGRVTWQDLQILCEDWDTHSSMIPSSPDPSTSPILEKYDDDDLFQDLDHEWESGRPSSKRRRLNGVDANMFSVPRFAIPSLDNPETTTSRIAKAVILDLNDPQLLMDVDRFDAKPPQRQSVKLDTMKGGRAAFAKGLSQRYNFSNDEAYEKLKENRQSKIRSTLGNLAVSHSMPALRLQWPYYKTKLEKQEARSFHRPALTFQRHEPVTFSKPRLVKRKHLKAKDTKTIFENTKDLTLGDNSNVLLLEYSEEYPAMLSNFGMGNRLINYYRRKNTEDNTRPKLDIGETTLLLPHDKSPFSIFGYIDPGQITPALYNGMYKAPLFKQESKPTDFLVIRNTTGVDGSTWYIRNIENLHVVGQEFPSTDVPGPHSRKVTTASKNRLKMISYRRIRRNKPHRISVAEVTKHFTDSTDMQNRQKMKEFMIFSKEYKEWEMRSGEAIPDEEAVRGMVKPEDVCLLESMQVGQQHLQDAGFTKGDDSDEDDENKEGQSIEQQLAPWYTSRNFLNAAQGKAMLQLHGEGDPTGRGEAFSFIKTSMKGGFKAIGESVEDTLEGKKLKELGGHSYNVARQQKAYEESIRRIWDAQLQSLTSNMEHSDTDVDGDHLEDSSEAFGRAATPRSETQTPAAFRRDDESVSGFSRFSNASQTGKILRITRDVRDKYGNLEEIEEVIRDPRVIRQYLKRRHAKEAETLKLDCTLGAWLTSIANNV